MPQPLELPFKRIFISGAAGVIGQEMVRRLAALLADIRCWSAT